MDRPETYKETVARFSQDYDTISYTERDLMYLKSEGVQDKFVTDASVLDEPKCEPEGGQGDGHDD